LIYLETNAIACCASDCRDRERLRIYRNSNRQLEGEMYAAEGRIGGWGC